MIRFVLAVFIFLVPSVHASAQTSDERTYSDMPVYVLYCDNDPGRISAGGGKEPSPQQLIDSGQCTGAEGVALTFVLAREEWDFESTDKDRDEWDVQDDAWFARCDMDEDGFCAVNAPAGFDILIGVVLHESTVLPGYEPAFLQPNTQNFTEFAGYGLAFIPTEDSATPTGDVADHQTMALNITHSGEAADVLTQWELNDKDADTYLATNADGWVSNIVAAKDTVEIDLVNIDDSAEVTATCGANDDSAAKVETTVDGDDLTIHVPNTASDIRCDISIED